MIGRVVASTYIGQDGKPHASLEVMAESVCFLGGKDGVNCAPGTGPGEPEMDIDEEDIAF